MKTKTYEQVEPDLSKMTFHEVASGGPYTAREYIQWTFDELVELIRGFVYKMSTPRLSHQDISQNLERYFFNYFDNKNGCRWYHAPASVFLTKPDEDWRDTKNVLEPDIFVACDESKLIDRGCIGAPDFVIEILSKSTAKRDQEIKFDLYEEYGVPEYWIVNPFNQTVLMFRLDNNGRYETIGPMEKTSTIAPLQFLDLKIDLEEIFLE